MKKCIVLNCSTPISNKSKCGLCKRHYRQAYKYGIIEYKNTTTLKIIPIIKLGTKTKLTNATRNINQKTFSCKTCNKQFSDYKTRKFCSLKCRYSAQRFSRKQKTARLIQLREQKREQRRIRKTY